MNINSLGKITVPAAGTPVTLPTVTCAGIRITPVPTNTGNIFVGTPGMNKGTGAGVICVLPPVGTSGQVETYKIHSPGDSVYLAQFALDAAVSGEGAYVSYVTE